MGVVTDAATLTCACVVGAEKREPYMMYRRGRRAILNIADRLHLKGSDESWTWLTRENFELAWNQLTKLNFALKDKEEAWALLQDLREPYGRQLQQLIDYLMAPHGFWGHSAEETVVDELTQASAEARLRARRRA